MLNVTIPANTSAEVHLPTGAEGAVLADGRPLRLADGIQILSVQGGRPVVEIGGGTWSFECQP